MVALAMMSIFATNAFAASTYFDMTPPPGSTSNNTKPVISVKVSDPAGISTGFQMKVDGVTRTPRVTWGPNNSYCMLSYTPTSALKNGTHTVYASVFTGAGRTSYTWTFSVKVAPAVGPLSPADGTTSTTRDPEISAVVACNGVALSSYTMTVDGVAVSPTYNATTKKISYTPTTPLANDADHAVTLSVTDATGMSTSLAWSFFVQIYADMADTAGCSDCHIGYPTVHPMTACDVCHAPEAPVPSYWDMDYSYIHGVSYLADYDCTYCHSSAFPAVPTHVEDVGLVHYTGGSMAGCPCHVRSLTVEHNRYFTDAGTPIACITCHASTDSAVVAAMAAGTPGCTDCHVISADHPYADVDHVADVGETLDPSGVACGTCHAVDLMSEHEKSTSASAGGACETCHGMPRDSFGGWNQACSQGGCHASGSATEPHTGAAAAHTQSAPLPGCVDAGCHSNDLGSVHVSAEASGTAGQTLTSCAVCHAQGIPATKTCASCHPDAETSGHEAVHVLERTDTCVDCHAGTSLTSVHIAGAGLTCQTCHGSTDTEVLGAIVSGTLACDACHTTQGVDYHLNMAVHKAPESYESCGHCHHSWGSNPLVGPDVTRHAGGCMTCHDGSIDLSTMTTKCINCHNEEGVDYHYETALRHTPLDAGSLECAGCHDTTDVRTLHATPGCETCHATKTCTECHSLHAGEPGTALLTPLSCSVNCHTTEGTDYHSGFAVAHEPAVTNAGCFDGSGCHAMGDLAGLHENASTVVGGETREGCDVCHADGTPVSKDCTTCHGTEGVGYHAGMNVAHASPTTSTCFGTGCHDISKDIATEHARYAGPGAEYSSYDTSCELCHGNADPERIDWTLATAQCTGVCHGGTTHSQMTTQHAPTSASGTCTSCHGTDLNDIHGTYDDLTRCAMCHTDRANWSKSGDCASCHSADPHPAGTHNIAGPCAASGCHVTDVKAVHDSVGTAGPGCVACHATGVTASFSCGQCHATPHADENHGSTETCTSCHSTGNIVTVHGGKCTTCHPTPATPGTVYTGCTQANCHPSVHPEVAGHNSGHGDGDDCWSCHPADGGGCDSCHPDVYERGLPVTTSDVKASYTSYAVVRLTAVDQGQYGWTSGIKATYYQIDGGAIQTGGTVVVAAPATGTKSHSIEFWSMDWNHNTEAHHVVSFNVAAGPPDTVAPTGTMTVNSGAVWATATGVTVNSAVVDSQTGVIAMRVDPGTGVFGAWTDHFPNYAITLPAVSGAKVVRAEYKDAGGNVLSLSDGIILDMTPPSGSVLINSGAAYTNTLAVNLTLNATDALSGVADMRFMDNGNWIWSAWEPYASSKSYVMHGAYSGSRTVYVQYRDVAGGMSYAYGIADAIGYDIVAPTGTMTVNNGATFTASTAVTLNSAISDSGGSGIYQMAIDPGSGTFGSPVTYASTYAFTLAPGQGLKTVRVEYSDRAGNKVTKSYSITLGAPDTTPPTGSVVINAGAAWTSGSAVTLSLSASDTGSGMGQMRFSNDNVTWSTWETYATTKPWTLTAGAGAKTVYAQFRDVVGNGSVSYSDGITVDSTAPTGSVVINAGAASTNTQSVSLTLAATDTGGSGLTQMRFSNDNVTWSAWESYAASKAWSLSGGDGLKTVYAQYRDVAGCVSISYADTITMSAGQPFVTQTLSLPLTQHTWVDANDGAYGAWGTYTVYVNDALIGVKDATTGSTWNCPQIDLPSGGHIDIVADCGFSSFSWVFDEYRPNTYTLTLPAGTMRLDAATWSGFPAMQTGTDWYDGYDDYYTGVGLPPGTIANITYTMSVSADTIAPTGSVAINAGAAYTNASNVTLALSASDTGGSGLTHMCFSNDNSTWSTWEAYAATKNWTLSGGTGVKTVYVQYRDGSGNISTTYSDSITVDMAAPTGSVAINGGAASANSTAVTLTMSASDAGGSGVSQMRVSNDNATWSSWVTYATSYAWSLTPGDGTKTVYVQYRDALGNTSASYSDTITLAVPGTATLAFVWNGWGYAELHVENAQGAIIASTSVEGGGSDLSWNVTVPSGQDYYMVCDYYEDYDWGGDGGGYGIWSSNTSINTDGVLSPGETVTWNY